MSKLKILVLVAVMTVIALLLIPAVTSAQQMPPCRVQGTATLDGMTAANGTTVTALIDGTQVAQGTVASGQFKVQFDATSYIGKTITFTVGTGTANETATAAYGLVKQNLTATSGAVTPTPTPTPTPLPSGGITSVTVTGISAGATPSANYDPSTGVLALGIPKGDTGAAGAAGAAGVAGPAGQPGSGSQGPEGPKGKSGSAALGIVALIIAIVALLAAGFVMIFKRRAA